MHRRALLAALTAALVGCNGPAGGQSGPGDATDTPAGTTPDGSTPAPSDGGEEKPRVLDARVETVETDCMGSEGERVAVAFLESGLRVDGVAETPTPCYEAAVEAATVEDGEAVVELGFESTDEVCVECVGRVTYEATVDLEGADDVSRVTVVHGATGERFERRRGETPT